MAGGTAKPVIFISYSHLDEPERTPEGDIHWLTDIQAYLAPAANGTFELWTDENMAGGVDWEKEIKDKLAVCDICILFVSRHSLASSYVIEVEIATILERQRNGQDVPIYPIVLSPFPQAAAPASLLALNLRPRLDKPLSGFSRHRRGVEISKIADEIVGLLGKKVSAVAATTKRPTSPSYVHITGLPETAYERLVGRDDELKRLDEAWADLKINIISLVAEGGAGKSALVNEWLKRLQADNYRGAEAVLGWSFYNQGTKERASSADEFLNWTLGKLGIKLETTSAAAKGEAIAETLMQHRVLLVLDGVEPLQHGLDTQLGQLKDQGLRALLRRFAATPPEQAHGLIVLTSRLAVKDVTRWRTGPAQVIDVGRLSDAAGAALLRDNGVWGTDKELNATAHDFEGHPLALGLLASFLKETQMGDVRRRDHVRAYLADSDNPRHDHARRVMESYENEWLAGHPLLLAIMHIIGLFDRPASDESLRVLRETPVIYGFPDIFIDLSDLDWNRAVTRLRETRLLAPADSSTPTSLDAHPLIREWFGERFRTSAPGGWRVAHARLYEHLRDTTREGKKPTLEDLAPLYQAIRHGCSAGWHREALKEIYQQRICHSADDETQFYASRRLGAHGSNLAAISWLFERPYSMPVQTLSKKNQSWLLSHAAHTLRAQGRLVEALNAQRAAIAMLEGKTKIAPATMDIADAEILVGEIESAIKSAERAVIYADKVSYKYRKGASRALHACALHMSGHRNMAEALFKEAERRMQLSAHRLLPSIWGFRFCDLMIDLQDFSGASERALKTLEHGTGWYTFLSIALDILTIGRSQHGLALINTDDKRIQVTAGQTILAHKRLNEADDEFRTSGQNDHLPLGLLARASFRRSVGDWASAVRDLDEVEEIAAPGPMRLHLCDTALGRARLEFARIDAFAPLNGMLEKDNPPKPAVPSAEQIAELKSEAEKQLKIAADYIETCGYHRRDEELAELQAVLRGERKFADLPPRV